MNKQLMRNTIIIATFLIWGAFFTVQSQEESLVNTTILAEGLYNPVGMAVLPNGNVLIAEEGTGNDDLSAGVSMMLPDGTIGRLISGFPSSRDSGDLSGVALVNVSPDGETIYIGNFNASHLWTLPSANAETLPETPYTQDDLGVAVERLNNVFLVNPFDMTFDEEGIPVVVDATGNGVAKEQDDGTVSFFHRFDELTDPLNDILTIQAVPTGITRVDEEYYVALFGGCPYPANSGEIVAIDENRNQRTVIDNLNMPIDVALANDGRLWVLEFATFTPDGSCFTGTGYRPETGRLSYFEDGELIPVLDNLEFPGSVLPLADGSLYLTEVFNGRIIHVTFGDASSAQDNVKPEVVVSPINDLSTILSEANTSPLFLQVDHNTNDEDEAGWHFEDVADEVGIDFTHQAFETDIFADPAAMMGGGVCWIDYDKDGWLDIYWVNSYAEDEAEYWAGNGGLPKNALYRNDNGSFTEVSEITRTNLSMRGNGCVVADFDNNGWDDIFITADGENVLLLNNEDHQFQEVGAIAGLNAPEWNSAAAVADLNGDGWLDLFVGSYIDIHNTIPNPIGAFPQDYYGIPDRLYLNNGTNSAGIPTFTEITREVGLVIDERTLGAVFSDVDHDNDLDLFIANDGQPNRLYLFEPADNTYGFTLVDTYDTSGVNDRGSGMGVASGDWTGDGLLDLMVTNWDTELNSIYRNNMDETGYPSFVYSTYRIGMVGLGNNMTGWGVHFADLDHDTDLDLMTVNGRVPVSNFETDAELIRLYGNHLVEGNAGEFREWTQIVGLEDVGTRMARGSALADFDNDGDLDLAVNSIGGEATLLLNNAPSGNWITLGFGQSLPGTRITLSLDDGTTLEREVHVGSSYLASEDPRVHFGLGDAVNIQQIMIQYTTGESLILENISANQSIHIELHVKH